MHYRSLLVLLGNSIACAERTQLAMRLACERDCHLVGLAPTGLIDVPSGSEAAAPLANYAAMAWDVLRDEAERATQRFRDECHVAGVKSHEGVIDEADKASSVVRHAHCSDLVVLTQARLHVNDEGSRCCEHGAAWCAWLAVGQGSVVRRKHRPLTWRKHASSARA